MSSQESIEKNQTLKKKLFFTDFTFITTLNFHRKNLNKRVQIDSTIPRSNPLLNLVRKRKEENWFGERKKKKWIEITLEYIFKGCRTWSLVWSSRVLKTRLLNNLIVRLVEMGLVLKEMDNKQNKIVSKNGSEEPNKQTEP